MLKIPVTASSMPEWVRRCADAVNALGGAVAAADRDITALQGQAASLAATDTTQNGRLSALETFAAVPFAVASVTFKPAALPSSPVKGMTAFDSTDNKLKCYDGTAWQALF